MALYHIYYEVYTISMYLSLLGSNPLQEINLIHQLSTKVHTYWHLIINALNSTKVYIFKYGIISISKYLVFQTVRKI